MKGKIYKGNIIRAEDKYTGVAVSRLTDDDGDTYHPYFTSQLIDSENKNIIVVSTRTGSGQIFSLNLKNGDMIQLTDIKNRDTIPKPVLDIVHNYVYYFEGRVFKKLRLDNFYEEELLTIPEGFHSGDLTLTDKGDYAAFTYSKDLECITVSDVIYSNMAERFHQHPLSVVFRYDIANNKTEAVWGEHEWISHTLISPVDPNYIAFCHEGGSNVSQRLWMIKTDTKDVYPLIRQKPHYDNTVHEFFTASGRIGTQYSFRHRKDVPFYLEAEIYINPDGSDEKRYYYPYNRPGHIQTNFAETMSAGDRAQIKRDMPDYENYMSLMIPSDDHRLTVGLLCYHGTSWKTQKSHPHPIFTRDDSHVIFSSDAGGRCNVYMVEANWDKCIKSV